MLPFVRSNYVFLQSFHLLFRRYESFLTLSISFIYRSLMFDSRIQYLVSNAFTVKVEATKFTEVGYHGRDVDQIIRDLMDVSMQLTRRLWTEKLRQEAASVVEDRILDLLTGPPSDSQRGRESFRDMLKQGILDDQEIEVDVPTGDKQSDMAYSDGNNPNIVAMTDLWQRMSSGQGKKQSAERKKLPISEARRVILEVELEKMLEKVDLKKEAVTAVEESGIVFIDEM